MMAGHVMELDSISVEVVQDSNTELVPLPVVWLWTAGSSCRGPGNIVIRPSRGPADISIPNVSTSPEVFLAITGNKTEKLPLLGRTIQTDWLHCRLHNFPLLRLHEILWTVVVDAVDGFPCQ